MTSEVPITLDVDVGGLSLREAASAESASSSANSAPTPAPAQASDAPAAAAAPSPSGASDGKLSASALARQAADPLGFLEHWRTDTHAQMEALGSPLPPVVEAEYTPEQIALMEELREKVGLLMKDPVKMKMTEEDAPGGMHQHWTTYWPQGAGHPLFEDRVSHLDADPQRWPYYELMRFLVARDMNMKRAVKMLFAYKRWRVVWGASHIAQFRTMPFEPLIKSILSHQYHKLDKQGRPLYIQRSGLIDPHRFTTEVSLPHIGIGHTWFCEQMRLRCELGSRLHGRRIETLVNIIDIAHLGLSARKLLPIFSTTSFIDQHFYPETLGCLYIINAPSFFPPIFSLCKAFLSPKTQEKVKILGHNFQSTLLADLGAECLPEEYGGTCACPGGCCPLADGPAYTRPGEQGAVEEDVTVKAGQVHVHEVEYKATIAWSAEEGGGQDQLETWWTVELQAKDIDFSADFRPNAADAAGAGAGAEASSVLAVTRLVHQAAGPTTSGAYSGPHAGTLRLTFSNAYSRWNSKHVKLRTGSRIAAAYKHQQ